MTLLPGSIRAAAMSTPFLREELSGHRRRLAGIRPRIDASTPSSYFVLINRAKKDQLLSDWAHNVDTANLALLSRMTAIANQHTLDDHRAVTEDREKRHREQSDADRKREQKRIEDENARMIDRLQAQKSNYGTSNWQSHAAAYEKHIREVRLRQMLLADPIAAKKKIAEERDKLRAARQAKKAHKLKPLAGGLASGEAISYERDESANVEEKEAADAAEEEDRRAGVEVGSFDEVDADELLAADKAKSAGSVSLSEWMLPRTANHTPLHQDSHTIDSHLVLLTIDEVNRSTARSDVPLGDDWSAFTTHPPSFLHAYLLRSYDLDSGLHSHLYLPVQAVTVLAKGVERRLERVIALLGYTEEGELFFKRSLMPKAAKAKEDKKVARLYAGRRERANNGEKKQERKVVEEPKPAEVKTMKRAAQKPKANKRMQEEKEQMSATTAGENEPETAAEQTGEADTQASQPEEEESYQEDESEAQPQQQPLEEAETSQPEATAAADAELSPQQSADISSQPQAENVVDTETQTITQLDAEKVGEQNQQPQPDVASTTDKMADQPQSAESSAAVSVDTPQHQPADDTAKPEQEEKQADEEYADDSQSDAQSPAVVSQPASNAASPVPAFHKQLPPPPATNQQQQPARHTEATNAASPHLKAAAEEKEATPTPATTDALSIAAPASPSVSAKGVAHQHRSVASPISGRKKATASAVQ